VLVVVDDGVDETVVADVGGEVYVVEDMTAKRAEVSLVE